MDENLGTTNIDLNDSTGPIDPKDFSSELEAVCKKEYPNTDVESHDYTQVFVEQKARNVDLSFSIIAPKEGETLEQIKPMGELGGIFEASLFITSYLERILDSSDRKNSYLVYPTFNKGTNALEKLLLLKYPNEIFQSILLDENIMDIMFKEPPKMEAMEALQKIKRHFPRR